MKTGGFILAVLVFLLTVIPCCTFDECEAEGEAERAGELTEDHSAEDCESICSPFLNCGGCAGFVFNAEDFAFTATPQPDFIVSVFYRARITGEIIQNIWQPPRKLMFKAGGDLSPEI